MTETSPPGGDGVAETTATPPPIVPPATLGFAGLGAMGGPMAGHLVRAGYAVRGFDTDAERLGRAAGGGVRPAADLDALVDGAEVVLTSLPSSESFVQAAERHFLPRARPGQLFLDLGTVTPPETRRLAGALAARGASLVDAPVSGGPDGALQQTLLIFVGGDPAAVARLRPILDVLAARGRVTHFGPSGAGQLGKGVNQLAMGLGAAAYLEAVAFGVVAGLDPAAIAAGVGDETGWRAAVRRTAERIAAGRGETMGVKFRELPYYLREAAEAGFRLPLTEALYAFCDAGERVVVDDNRPAPSFLHQLLASAEAQA